MDEDWIGVGVVEASGSVLLLLLVSLDSGFGVVVEERSFE